MLIVFLFYLFFLSQASVDEDTGSINSFKTCPSEPNLSFVPRQISDSYASTGQSESECVSAAAVTRLGAVIWSLWQMRVTGYGFGRDHHY